ncbi:response regulator transcription factor [Nitratiruptor sp. SB155-2]|uniref:response regulator transcription factor n=1 Tax=Nitratiruptor sp. (strain SB155-2) TaxID=387092 RepID=UPI0001586EE6|nr:response regulator transcription factor [Nitratiruptor sp. SB155-2]BAF69233.1 two-component response regulator [Nitratiruptor sp. SB155-2]
MKTKILLLEDDNVLSETMVDILESRGFSIKHVISGEEALDATFQEEFDLLILDVNVPTINGFDLLKNLRDGGITTPAIFITARTDIDSLAQGFEVGADDYLKKPFDFDELLIRIEALLRKTFHTRADEIVIGDFRFYIGKDELYKNGDYIALPPAELKLTRLFFQQRGHTIEKSLLLETLNEGTFASENALRVHINRLRKIGLPILTVKGIGYRLETS